jgi:hypothetical protein
MRGSTFHNEHRFTVSFHSHTFVRGRRRRPLSYLLRLLALATPIVCVNATGSIDVIIPPQVNSPWVTEVHPVWERAIHYLPTVIFDRRPVP